MNFDRFKSRLQAHAEAAANAARNFQSLDQMAAQDDYVHSPDLKVSNGNSRQRQQEPKRHKQLRVETSSSTVSSDRQAEKRQQHHQPISRTPSSASQMLPVVANTVKDSSAIKPVMMNGTTLESSASSTQHSTLSKSSSSMQTSVSGKRSLLPSFSSMGDSDEEYDPVLERMKASVAMYPDIDRNEDNGTMEKTARTKKKKNPNRFMEDLEERLAVVEEPAPVPLPSPPRSRDSVSSVPSSTTSDWLGWARNTRLGKNLVSAGRILESSDASDVEMKGILSKHADEQKAKEEALNGSDDIESGPIQVVSGSMVLDAAEQAELDRMRSGSRSGLVSMLLSLVKQNPRHSFIGLTLVLYLAAYFYSRHRGNEDDVA